MSVSFTTSDALTVALGDTAAANEILAILNASGTVTPTFTSLTVSGALSFFGAPPVATQPSGASQASVTQTQTILTDNSGGTASTTLAAISDVPTKNAVASLAAELALIKTDIANTLTLLLAIRTVLVNYGLMKGSA